MNRVSLSDWQDLVQHSRHPDEATRVGALVRAAALLDSALRGSGVQGETLASRIRECDALRERRQSVLGAINIRNGVLHGLAPVPLPRAAQDAVLAIALAEMAVTGRETQRNIAAATRWVDHSADLPSRSPLLQQELFNNHELTRVGAIALAAAQLEIEIVAANDECPDAARKFGSPTDRTIHQASSLRDVDLNGKVTFAVSRGESWAGDCTRETLFDALDVRNRAIHEPNPPTDIARAGSVLLDVAAAIRRTRQRWSDVRGAQRAAEDAERSRLAPIFGASGCVSDVAQKIADADSSAESASSAIWADHDRLTGAESIVAFGVGLVIFIVAAVALTAAGVHGVLDGWPMFIAVFVGAISALLWMIPTGWLIGFAIGSGPRERRARLSSRSRRSTLAAVQRAVASGERGLAAIIAAEKNSAPDRIATSIAYATSEILKARRNVDDFAERVRLPLWVHAWRFCRWSALVLWLGFSVSRLLYVRPFSDYVREVSVMMSSVLPASD